MPSRIDESPRLQHDRHRQPERPAAAEPRNLHVAAPQTATPASGAHAGFDEHLNPIDDELINTHGSER